MIKDNQTIDLSLANHRHILRKSVLERAFHIGDGKSFTACLSAIYITCLSDLKLSNNSIYAQSMYYTSTNGVDFIRIDHSKEDV